MLELQFLDLLIRSKLTFITTISIYQTFTLYIIKNTPYSSFKNTSSYVSFFGSGALSGLMLDLGLLEIIWRVFFLILAPTGGSNPSRPYPYTFPNPVGAKLGFT